MVVFHLFNISFALYYRYQTNTTKETLETILNIQPKDSGGGSGETRESIVMRQSQDMLSKLPADYVPHEVRKSFVTLNLTVLKKLLQLL